MRQDGFEQIADWSDAYENRAHVPGFDRFIDRWAEAGAKARETAGPAGSESGRGILDIAYGTDPRQQLDLYMPSTEPSGLAVFVHGGYWRSFGRESFGHLAAGARAAGYAVAVPSYRLAPTVGVPQITADVAAAVTLAADRIAGPLYLAGHSAGGHLVTRLGEEAGPLPAAVAGRIAHILSISGLHDLRPLLATDKNDDLRLDEQTAAAESPALRAPRPGLRYTAWVGGDERPEFVRQSALIANIWLGLGASTRLMVQPGLNHFDVIEPLEHPDSPLTRAFLGA
ncbi:MAG: alpha/beta hydrolase [Pseudomonadota bacterium]